MVVFVGFVGGWVGVFGGVVEGVGVSYLDVGGFVFDDNLVSEVVVDVGGFFGEGGGLVDGVFGIIGSIERCIGSVFVNGDYVEGGVVVFVEEDFVVLVDDDNVLGVDGVGRVYEY